MSKRASKGHRAPPHTDGLHGHTCSSLPTPVASPSISCMRVRCVEATVHPRSCAPCAAPVCRWLHPVQPVQALAPPGHDHCVPLLPAGLDRAGEVPLHLPSTDRIHRGMRKSEGESARGGRCSLHCHRVTQCAANRSSCWAIGPHAAKYGRPWTPRLALPPNKRQNYTASIPRPARSAHLGRQDLPSSIWGCSALITCRSTAALSCSAITLSARSRARAQRK